jgi:hypothetical protein
MIGPFNLTVTLTVAPGTYRRWLRAFGLDTESMYAEWRDLGGEG